MVQTNDQWIRSRTGILSALAAGGNDLDDVRAGRPKALAEAKLSARTRPDYFAYHHARYLLRRPRASFSTARADKAAHSISYACSGFLYALSSAVSSSARECKRI